MIRFSLHCPEGHQFESWFRDGDAYQALSVSGGLVCPTCGSTEIEKSLMTPQVRPARKAMPAPADADATAQAAAPRSGRAAEAAPGAGPGSNPVSSPDSAGDAAADNDRDAAIAALRARIEAEADYVGRGFVSEARAIHTGDAPNRPIYGEAKPDEAMSLIRDGVPVAPLPFVPTRKLN